MMCKQEPITESLIDLGTCLRQHHSVREQVLVRIKEADVGQRTYPTAWYLSRPAKAFLGLAACLVLIAVLWMAGGDGAQEAFAAAIESVQKARAFSCKVIDEFTEDGRKIIQKRVFMFKEPNLERHEWLSGVDDQFIGAVTITDYDRRRKMSYKPAGKTAELMDLSAFYDMDPDTGKPELTQLDTGMRDQILSLRAGAVEDLGSVELDGQSVRLLQSRRGKSVIKVWIDPLTDLPVQLAIQKPASCWTYTSIKIDQEMDDGLFSLEPPDGYSLFRGGMYKPWPDDVGKMYAKMMHLCRACYIYAMNHDNQFPEELTDLDIEAEVLKNLLAAPGRPDGPAVIRYRQPRPDADSKEIMLYESYEQWPDRGVAVGYVGCHCSVIAKQEQFEELMR
ncbi:MAG: hypothetical protein ACYTF1_00140 [Planctomycetota bacterium]|jgi:outer membrane lipoprotein-sorting protein